MSGRATSAGDDDEYGSDGSEDSMERNDRLSRAAGRGALRPGAKRARLAWYEYKMRDEHRFSIPGAAEAPADGAVFITVNTGRPNMETLYAQGDASTGPSTLHLNVTAGGRLGSGLYTLRFESQGVADAYARGAIEGGAYAAQVAPRRGARVLNLESERRLMAFTSLVELLQSFCEGGSDIPALWLSNVLAEYEVHQTPRELTRFAAAWRDSEVWEARSRAQPMSVLLWRHLHVDAVAGHQNMSWGTVWLDWRSATLMLGSSPRPRDVDAVATCYASPPTRWTGSHL
jgi:hypothetical protein